MWASFWRTHHSSESSDKPAQSKHTSEISLSIESGKINVNQACCIRSTRRWEIILAHQHSPHHESLFNAKITVVTFTGIPTVPPCRFALLDRTNHSVIGVVKRHISTKAQKYFNISTDTSYVTEVVARDNDIIGKRKRSQTERNFGARRTGAENPQVHERQCSPQNVSKTSAVALRILRASHRVALQFYGL